MEELRGGRTALAVRRAGAAQALWTESELLSTPLTLSDFAFAASSPSVHCSHHGLLSSRHIHRSSASMRLHMLFLCLECPSPRIYT